MPLCLAASAVTAVLAAEAFTLAWTHSIEKIRWEEDWRIADNALVLVEARIRGTGAGMEPPPGAVLENGVWRYRPRLPPQAMLRLTHSPHAQAYEFCVAGRCAGLGGLLPQLPANAVVTASPCG